MASKDFRLRPTVILAARGAALALAVAAIGATESEGQGLKGRLKRAAGQKAVEETAQAAGVPSPGKGGAVRFDSVIVELDQTRLDQVMVSFAAGRRVLDGVDGGVGVATLAARRDDAIDRRVALYDKNSAAIEEYHNTSRRVRECRDDKFGAMDAALQESYQQRILSDPELQAKMVEFGHKLAAAQAARDTARMRQLNVEALAIAKMAPSAADSAKVDAACGRLPKPLPVLTTIDSLDGAERKLVEEIRKTEQRAAAAERAAAGGMTVRQLAMARERIEIFLASGSNRRPNGFSDRELEALAARRGELEKVI